MRYQEELVLQMRYWDNMNACNGTWYEISVRIGMAVKILGWYERM